MAAHEGPRKVLPTPDIHEPLGPPLELRCGACGRKGKYHVGRIYIDPSLAKHEDPEWVNEAFCFTAYFHCKHCKAGGPWELTAPAKLMLLALLAEATFAPERARIHLATMTLFDGTTPRWATQGEAHLKQLIEQDPGNYFLWSRLGNLYAVGEAPDLALEAFHKAVERNEHDVESLHSIAAIHEERQEDELAARYYHQVLLHARHAPVKTPRELLRSMLRQTLETLAELHLRSGKRIPFLPEQPLPEVTSPQEAVIVLSHYDLSDERDLNRMVDWWMTGQPPVSAPQPKRVPIRTPQLRSSAPPAATRGPERSLPVRKR